MRTAAHDPRPRSRKKSPGVGRRASLSPLLLALALALASTIVGGPSPAEAHQVGLSQGLFRVVVGDVATGGGESVSVTLTLARGELRKLVREVDQDRDGEVSEVELMLGASAIEAVLARGLRISIDERSCTQRFDGASLTEEDGLEIALFYSCPPLVDDPAMTSAGGGPPLAAAKIPGEPSPTSSTGAPHRPPAKAHEREGAGEVEREREREETGEREGTTTGEREGTTTGERRAAEREEEEGKGKASVDVVATGNGPGELRIDFTALVALGGAHRHIARIIPPGSPGVRAERVLHRLRTRARVPLADALVPAPAKAPEPGSAPTEPQRSADEADRRAGAAEEDMPTASPGEPSPATPPIDRDLAAYFFLGVEHILSGVDHLVFLLGLMIAGGRLRDWALMITAFTVGHSASLALATLGIWTPSPSLIEPLIAASIVYIGLENLVCVDPAALRQRWRLTLPFGFVHGFGFAGALAEVGLTAADGAIAWLLALFNLGVEAGQLAALTMMALLLRAVPQLSRTPAKRWISAAIALAGLVWLIDRVL